MIDDESAAPPDAPPMRKPPDEADTWHPDAVDAWAAIWRSRAALALNGGHIPALRRYVGLVHLRSTFLALATNEPVMTLENGGIRLHPLFGEIRAMTAELRHIEDRFGLTLKAELALGLSVARTAAAAAKVESGRDDNLVAFDPRRID